MYEGIIFGCEIPPGSDTADTMAMDKCKGRFPLRQKRPRFRARKLH